MDWSSGRRYALTGAAIGVLWHYFLRHGRKSHLLSLYAGLRTFLMRSKVRAVIDSAVQSAITVTMFPFRAPCTCFFFSEKIRSWTVSRSASISRNDIFEPRNAWKQKVSFNFGYMADWYEHASPRRVEPCGRRRMHSKRRLDITYCRGDPTDTETGNSLPRKHAKVDLARADGHPARTTSHPHEDFRPPSEGALGQLAFCRWENSAVSQPDRLHASQRHSAWCVGWWCGLMCRLVVWMDVSVGGVHFAHATQRTLLQLACVHCAVCRWSCTCMEGGTRPATR